MAILYNDPWKDRKFGKLKGDKKDEYLKVLFDEAKLYKHENSYVLAGEFTAYMGVTHAYNPTTPPSPGLCELPIYGSDYEIRQKKTGTGTNGTKSEYETVTLTPSIAEKLFYDQIENNPATYLQDGKSLKGSLTLHPDIDYLNRSDEDRLNYFLSNNSIEIIDESGKLLTWEAPKPFNKGGYNGYNNRISLEEKVSFLKKELASTVGEDNYSSDKQLPIAAYVHKIVEENSDNEPFIVCYFDLLNSLIS